MPTNRWRVIWGFMDANGNIVEEYANPAQEMYDYIHWNETEFHPSWENNTTSTADPIQSVAPSNTFSNYDVYNLQAQGYANQWDNAMANAYSNLANNLWRYSKFANNTLTWYDDLLNYLQQNERWLQNVAWKTYNTLVGDIQNQRDYINRMFWPDGELTREVNTYYDDLWNYLATDAWRQAAAIAAQWVHSWASLWAIRAQQNEAYNQSFWRYIQAKEQQINAKQQIASNLINYMANLRQEYWDTTNQYIIDLYKRANDMYNQVAASARQDLNQYNQLLATPTSSWVSTPQYTYDIYWNMIDDSGNIVKTKNELDKEIVSAMPFRDSRWNVRYYTTHRDWTASTVDANWNTATPQWSLPTNSSTNRATHAIW